MASIPDSCSAVRLRFPPLDHLLQDLVREDVGLVKAGDVGVLAPGGLLVAKHHQHIRGPERRPQLPQKAEGKKQRPKGGKPPPFSGQPLRPLL